MYTRSTRAMHNNSGAEIPVETFADSFSADAFLKTEKAQPPPLSEKSDDLTQNDIQQEENKIQPREKSKSFNINTDDLLLIGLLLLFITDKDNQGDIMLPLLLAVLLIFN